MSILTLATVWQIFENEVDLSTGNGNAERCLENLVKSPLQIHKTNLVNLIFLALFGYFEPQWFDRKTEVYV